MSRQRTSLIEAAGMESSVAVRGRGANAPRLAVSRPEEIGLADVLRVLWRRRFLIAGVVLASTCATWFYNARAIPLYEARARLLIDPGSSQVVPFKPVVAEDQARIEYYQTQVELLRSPTLVRQMIERTGAKGTVDVSDVLEGLTVSPVNQSRLVDVKFRSSNPAIAARIANGIAETYTEYTADVRRRAARDASAWLTERLSALRKQVDASENTLQKYREQKDAVSLDDRQNIVVQKLAQLSTAVTTARTERIEKQALLDQVRAVREGGAPLETLAAVRSNAFIQSLQSQLAELQKERAQLSDQLGSLHPEMIRVDTAIATVERKLNLEVSRVADGVRSDYDAALAKERGLLSALEAQKQEVLELNRKSIDYDALKRDATSTQDIFEGVLQRVKEADLSGELQTNNVRMIDRAVVPRMPVWPRWRLNLIVGMLGGALLGIVVAIGLEYLKHRIQTPEDLGSALGLPLLGITPRLSRMEGALASPAADALPPQFREALRSIRARILLSPMTAPIRALAVTSSGAGEGKTVIAANLAISVAVTGRRVLLVDADMRRPRLHRLFDVPRSPGLADVVGLEAKVSAAVRQSSIPNLFVMSAGSLLRSPSDVLDTEQFKYLVGQLTEAFDLVVLDCPPVMGIADASIVANAATAGLFVVGSGVATRDVAQLAIERLVSARVRVIGVVLNNADIGARTEPYYPYDLPEDDGDSLPPSSSRITDETVSAGAVAAD